MVAEVADFGATSTKGEKGFRFRRVAGAVVERSSASSTGNWEGRAGGDRSSSGWLSFDDARGVGDLE